MTQVTGKKRKNKKDFSREGESPPWPCLHGGLVIISNSFRKTCLQRILYRKHVLSGGKEMDKF